MARDLSRQSAPVEVNKFVAGLVTDASPLTFPDNASLSEENFVLNTDGSRNRRLGMDLEINYSPVTTDVILSDSEVVVNSYKWKNAGGIPEKSILVVQVGNQIKFFDLDSESISSNLIFTYTFTTTILSQVYSYSVVDGILVVVTGLKNPTTFEFQNPNSITVSTITLKIRDLFGVEDKIGSRDLYSDTNLQYRPTSLTFSHAYNLRNQSWGLPRINGDGRIPGSGNDGTVDYYTPVATDPISAFKGWSVTKFPSNSDSVNFAIYANPENTSNRTIERFFAQDLINSPLGNVKTANGYFIIDALERGSSRLAADAANRLNYPQLSNFILSLPIDRTPGGPTAISEFAGRVWYSGFSGDLVSGDSLSPRMSSYVLFSQVVENISDISQCYQEADPTAKDDPNIVDTDGGFIRINEAYGIKKLINAGSSLIVIAANGVWRIVGGSDTGFTATKYIVEKITDHGCTSTDSITFIDNTIMYWGDDALYHLKTDQFGTWLAENISANIIQKLFDDISLQDKASVKGSYDSFERKVRWLYQNRLLQSSETMELVLDLNLNAFSINRIKSLSTNSPKVASYYIGEPYQVTTSQESVTVLGDLVVSSGDFITTSFETRTGPSKKEIGYITILSTSPTITYSFASYRNTNFIEWLSVNGIGVDAEAFLITGYISGGDFQRDKQVLYLIAHMRRTETGYTVEGDTLVPLNPSSCILQSQWDWTNSNVSHKWSRPFQAYRYKITHFPLDEDDEFDTGHATIETKNKMRGNGRVVSFKFSTEPKKNLHLYGWSMILSVANNV